MNDGYDVVYYFKNNKALKGDKKFTVEWDEHMWLFATKQHADHFMRVIEDKNKNRMQNKVFEKPILDNKNLSENVEINKVENNIEKKD